MLSVTEIAMTSAFSPLLFPSSFTLILPGVEEETGDAKLEKYVISYEDGEYCGLVLFLG